MGFLSDRSPEAMAAATAAMGQDLASQVGRPLVAFVAGLAAPGALEGSLTGWGVSRRGHQVTGGATNRKNRFGLLAVTADGWLRLYRTKAARGRFAVEEEVRAWAPGGVEVRVLRDGWTLLIAVLDPADPLAFELVSTQVAVAHMVEPFAAQVGAVIEER